MSAVIRVTESELLAEIRRATAVDEAPPDAMTISELAAATKQHRCSIERQIAKLRANGRVKSYRVTRPDSNGRHQRTTAYVLLPAAKPG